MAFSEEFRRIQPRIAHFIRSDTFFIGMVVLFVVQASFIAVTGHFSMAFDEYYHLGSIEAYAKVWLPWSVVQPPGLAELGSVTTDTSYLFHYLMSFPYRLIGALTDDKTALILMLRLLSLAVFTGGLFVYRKLLLKVGLPRLATHVSLAFVMLLPVTPWLAGQLTYDSLFFTLSGLTLLCMVSLVQAMTRRQALPLSTLAFGTALLMLTSQVKYAFLPVALASGIFILGVCIREIRRNRIQPKEILATWRAELRQGSGMVAIGVLLLSSVLFMQRYGVNMIEYQSPLPDCSAVLSLDSCRAYDPYGRNQAYIDNGYYNDVTTERLLKYPVNWLIQMVRELYFAVGPLEAGYPAGNPLPVSYITGWVIALGSLGIIVVGLKRLLKAPLEIQLLLFVTAFYIGALFLRNIQDYIATGVPVAIHGRYILHLLPIIAVLVYFALPRLSAQVRAKYFVGAVSVLLLLTFYGGGIVPYSLRSTDSWYWPEAVPASHALRTVLSPVIIR